MQNASKKAELVAYEDLQSEALRRLYVEEMPLVVIIDCEGNNLYEQEENHIWKEHGIQKKHKSYVKHELVVQIYSIRKTDKIITEVSLCIYM